ncbi:hypothetical protein SDC9_86805 [bioreactor metagenome]|uniref:HEPN AbiU2-like domain-containing protein n=1 Tax=bioreactor metagenome TaxID=1076179 RepID=A0A644ZGZ7_9ZZZZ
MEIKEYTAGEVLFEIQEQVLTLNFQWNSYNQIFIHPYQMISDSISDSLHPNSTYNIAPVFFRYLKKLLQESILLTTVRLFDPAYSFPNGMKTCNLGIKYLLQQAELDFEKKEITKFLLEVDSFYTEHESTIFKYRDKLLAHNDLLTIKEKEYQETFEPIFISANIQKIIDFINTLTNDLGRLLLSKRVLPKNSYDIYAHPYLINFNEFNSDADKLISALQK